MGRNGLFHATHWLVCSLDQLWESLPHSDLERQRITEQVPASELREERSAFGLVTGGPSGVGSQDLSAY